MTTVGWEFKDEAEKRQPEFSLFHSNVLYAFSFAGEILFIMKNLQVSIKILRHLSCAVHRRMDTTGKERDNLLGYKALHRYRHRQPPSLDRFQHHHLQAQEPE